MYLKLNRQFLLSVRHHKEMSRNYNFTPFNYGNNLNKQQQPANNKITNLSAVPPPAALTGSRQSSGRVKASYAPIDSIAIPSQSYGKKRGKLSSDDDYFDDDEITSNNLEYLPAEGSPSAKRDEESDEEDPLDAFMAGLEKEEEKKKIPVPASAATASTTAAVIDKGVRVDIDDMDDEESYYKYMEDNPNAGVADDISGDELEYDEDGNPLAPARKRSIDPLPAIDHSEVDYKPFEKNFYVVHEEISGLTRNQKDELRHKLGIRVSGAAGNY